VAALELKHSERGWLPEAEARWEFDLEGEVWGSPALSGQHLILTNWHGEAGVVRCLSLESGDELWARQTKGKLTSSPIISRGVVYVICEAGELLGLRLEDGVVLWSVPLDTAVQATPLLLDGGLFVATLEGEIHSYF
jgi:eukaryotic-like serine/threonine-protein kinase